MQIAFKRRKLVYNAKMASESGDEHELTNLEAGASTNQFCYQFYEVLVFFFRDTEFHFSCTGFALCT
jgi:hypothetical protein